MGSVTVPTLQVRTQTGDGTSLGHRECVRKAGFRAKGDRLRKHPNHRGLRPSTPRATCTRRAGRPKIPFRAARPPPPPPRPRTSSSVRMTLGPPDTPASHVPKPPSPAGRAGRASPQPQRGRGAGAAVCACRGPGGGGRGERLGEGAPGVGHAALTRRTCCSSSRRRRRHCLTE